MKNKYIIFPIIAGIIFVALISTIIIKKINNKNLTPNKPTYPTQIANEFNTKLIKEVAKNKTENYLISPYSIEMALNLLKEGANNNTLTEIENLIGSRNINDLTIKDRIEVANAIFIKEKYKKNILDTYTDTIKTKYNSEILYDEFKTPKVINDWVNKKTNGMINNILNDISQNFFLGVANAIAIDVEWNSPFECIKTSSKEFTKENGTKINVEMMHEKLDDKSYKYLKNNNAKGIIIPYKSYNKNGKEEDSNNNLEFIGILPNTKVSEYITNYFNEEELSNLLKNEKTPSDKLEINLSLPRFKYDYSLDNLKEVLVNIGINDAFDRNNANFSKMATIPENVDNIYVEDAIHKTHIDLNEKGTKAAAVTYFGIETATSARPQEKEIINIEFNKPFIYIIRDKSTNEMLFFGVVYEPNTWQGSTCKEVEK